MLNEICRILAVTGASHEKVVDAVNREDFPDFEDCLQVQCAKEIKAVYIVTRNVSDYVCSDVQAVTPKEFAKKWSRAEALSLTNSGWYGIGVYNLFYSFCWPEYADCCLFLQRKQQFPIICQIP